MKQNELLEWFKEELLPTMIQQGSFGEKIANLEKCEFETVQIGVSSFASVPTFAKLIFNTPNAKISRDIFIKFQNQDPIFREKMKLTLQFKNEVTLYNSVVPNFGKFLADCGSNDEYLREIMPKCYFAMHSEEDQNKSIVVLEDLRKNGYGLSSSALELDLEHCMVSVEKLARFHAVSFAMKYREPDFFEKLKILPVDVWLEDNEWTRNQCRDFKGTCCLRGIDYLSTIENSEVPQSYLDNLKRMLEPNSLFDLLKNLHSPKEPLSVLCHGDFNRNNILYKYNSGKVIDAKLIDFQTYLYGSPCLDLSFFIYMNTTLEFREQYFDKLFNYYYSVLIKNVSSILKDSEKNVMVRLPFEDFMLEFERVALSAYVTVAFFLPIMMAPLPVNFEENMIEKTFKEMAVENYNQGGEAVSRRVADVIVDFYKREFYTSKIRRKV